MEKKVVNAVVKAAGVMGKCSNVLNKSLQDMLDIICKEHKGEDTLYIEVKNDSYVVLDQCSEEVAVGLVFRILLNIAEKEMTCTYIKITDDDIRSVLWEDLDLESQYNLILAIYDVYFKNGEK